MGKVFVSVAFFWGAVIVAQEPQNNNIHVSSIEWHVSANGKIRATPSTIFLNQKKGDKQIVKVLGNEKITIGTGKQVSKDEMKWIWSNETKIFNNTLDKDVTGGGYISRLQVRYNVSGGNGGSGTSSNNRVAEGIVGIFGVETHTYIDLRESITHEDKNQKKHIDKGIEYKHIDYKFIHNNEVINQEKFKNFDHILDTILREENTNHENAIACFVGNFDVVPHNISNWNEDFKPEQCVDESHADNVIGKSGNNSIPCGEICRYAAVCEMTLNPFRNDAKDNEYYIILPKWIQADDIGSLDDLRIDLKANDDNSELDIESFSSKSKDIQKIILNNAWKNYLAACYNHERGHKIIFLCFLEEFNYIKTLYTTKKIISKVCLGLKNSNLSKHEAIFRAQEWYRAQNKDFAMRLLDLQRRYHQFQDEYEDITSHGLTQNNINDPEDSDFNFSQQINELKNMRKNIPAEQKLAIDFNISRMNIKSFEDMCAYVLHSLNN